MTDPRPPLDYRGPHPPAERRTGRNFGLGLLAGAVASGAGWGVIYAAGRTDVFVVTLIVLVVGKVGAAAATAGSDRRVGFGPGLLVSFGVGLLIAGGLCFAALKNI